MNTALWILSVLLIVVGVAGTVLPALPGVILVLAGIVLGAWIDDFTRVSGLTVGIAAVLAIAAWLIEYFAGVMGAQKAGASKEAIVGARTVLDLLNAELELFTAQTRRARAAEQEVVASYRLRAATGDLDPASLGFGEDTYDPTANYRRVRDRWFGLSVDDPGAGAAR